VWSVKTVWDVCVVDIAGCYRFCFWVGQSLIGLFLLSVACMV